LILVLAWLIKSCQIWLQQGLKDPPEVLEATGQYRQEQDTLGAFLAECCAVGPNRERQKASSAYAAYKEWCEQSGERFVSNRKFCMALRDKWFETYTNNSLWFRGLALT
jgi:putative DNA primase/helicase